MGCGGQRCGGGACVHGTCVVRGCGSHEGCVSSGQGVVKEGAQGRATLKGSEGRGKQGEHKQGLWRLCFGHKVHCHVHRCNYCCHVESFMHRCTYQQVHRGIDRC